MRLAWLLLACRAPVAPVQEGDSGEVEADDGVVRGLTAMRHSHSGSMLTVQWDQPVAGQTRVVALLDGQRLEAPLWPREAGAQRQVFVGLPYDHQGPLWVEVDGVPSAAITVTTAPVPYGVPTATVWTAEDEAMEPGMPWLLLSMDGSTQPDRTFWALIVDRRGRVVWAQEAPADRMFLHPQLTWEGDALLLDHNSFWAVYDEGQGSTVVRQTLDGVVQETIPTPGLHHPFQALPGGAVAWGALEGHGQEERLLIHHPGGTVQELWACSSVPAVADAPDGCISNTLRYDEARGAFLFSFFTLETVFEIDAETGQTRRAFGHLDGAWAFEPADSAFWWQHGVYYTEAGTLLTSARIAPDVDETVVREYRLDEEEQRLVEVWSYGAGEGVYGRVLGEAWRLPGGNTLHNLGEASRLREITPDGRVVWDIGWQRDKWLGRSTPLADLYALLPDQGR